MFNKNDLQLVMSGVRCAVWVGLVSCLLLAGPAGLHAAEADQPTGQTETQPAAQTGQPQPWKPEAPVVKKFDWIQLNSGEWLKGELKRLYDKKLEFDSDELGLLELDWNDVKQVRGQRPFSVYFDERVTAEGLMLVTDEKVYVTIEGDRQEFERAQLVSFGPGATREIDYWSGKITFGATLTRGNTEQTQWSSEADIKRRTSNTRLTIDWLGNFTEADGEQTVDNQRLNFSYDVFMAREYYLRPIFGEFFRDPFSNIRYRYTVGTALGYHIIDTPKTEWDVTVGPAYQETRFESVEAGENETESTPALVGETRFDTELTRTLDFDFRYNFQIVNEASGTYTHTFNAKLSTELTRWLDLDLSFVWNRIQDPQPAEDGTVPKQDDFFYIIGLGIEF